MAVGSMSELELIGSHCEANITGWFGLSTIPQAEITSLLARYSAVYEADSYEIAPACTQSFVNLFTFFCYRLPV
jgi:hypothetical protein